MSVYVLVSSDEDTIMLLSTLLHEGHNTVIKHVSTQHVFVTNTLCDGNPNYSIAKSGISL